MRTVLFNMENCSFFSLTGAAMVLASEVGRDLAGWIGPEFQRGFPGWMWFFGFRRTAASSGSRDLQAGSQIREAE